MDLIILRHGKAEDTNPRGDNARELTEKGARQAQRQARFLMHAGLLPEIVLTSPLARARQTAHEFCKTGNIPGEIIQDWLACGMTPDTALNELAGFSEFKRVAIVGHEPDLSSLIACLIGSSPASIEMKKGGMACLKIQPPSRRATLRFLVPPYEQEDPPELESPPRHE